jgi:hypothetical protein
MSIAWPVPSATTFTSTPVDLVNAGSIWAKRPDCSVEVVDAITIDWACTAHADVLKTKDSHTRREKRELIELLL